MPWVPTAPMQHSIVNPNIATGAWESDMARIEEIYLARREHNKRGYGPTSDRAKPLPWMTEPAEPVTSPKAKRAKPVKALPVERRESLGDMAHRIGAKKRSV